MSSTILTNWTVYYADDAAAGAGMKQIKWTGGGTGTNTVNQLYTALMDLFDAAVNNDAADSIPIKAITPTLYEIGIVDAGDRQPWFIDPESVKHLTGGGLNSVGWTRSTGASNGIYKITRSGTNIVAGDVGATINNGTRTGWLLHVSGNYLWVRPTDGAAGNDWNVSSGTITCNGHSDTQTGYVTAENIWTNIYSLGSLESGTQLYVYQNAAALTPWWSTGHIDILVLVSDFGTLIDSGILTIYARQFSKLYDHTGLDASGGGRIPVPLATFPDTNNTTSLVTVAGYSDISITFGSFSHDLNNGNGTQPYNVDINCAGRTVAQVYEYLKYVTRQGETTTLNSIPGEAYISANVLYNPVKAAPFGTFAGGRFFGARGVYLYNMATADANKYELIDANGVLQAPPQSITLTVTGLAVNDQVAVFRATGDNNIIDKTIFTLYDAHSAGSTEIRVASGPGNPIPNDTPTTGYIRVVQRNASGRIMDEQKWPYVSWNNTNQASGWSTFVLSGTTGTYTYDTTTTAYVPYIDTTADATTESVSLIYVTDRYLTARVRKSGILPFMAKYQITNTNLTITAVRSNDPILP